MTSELAAREQHSHLIERIIFTSEFRITGISVTNAQQKCTIDLGIFVTQFVISRQEGTIINFISNGIWNIRANDKVKSISPYLLFT